MADSVALTLSLAIVSSVPYWFGALVLAWLTDEVYIHRKTGVLGQLVHGKTPWLPPLLGHGSVFIPSFLLLFLGYTSLLAFVGLLLMFFASGGPSPEALSFVTPILGVGVLLSVGGFLVPRRSNRRFASGGDSKSTSRPG